MIISLETGLYTLRISGEDGAKGVALVELYALPKGVESRRFKINALSLKWVDQKS